MPISVYGSINPAAAAVPDIYVNINAPPSVVLPGAPSDILLVVGTASWGPKNSPAAFADPAQGSVIFGGVNARKYDLMTQAYAAAQNGAKNMRGIRVTDGTDTAGSVVLQTNGLTVTSKYTGSGHQTSVRIDPGSAANTFKVVVSRPGFAPEVFDNIPGTLNAAWVNIAAAINNGNASRGPSQLVVATAGASTTSPTTGGGDVALTGGTDGVTSITAATLVGSDTAPRTGMYAGRNTGAAVGILADADDSTTWAAQAAYGLSELTYMFGVSPSGDTISNFKTLTAGIDTPWFKPIFGDWCYWLDPTTGRTRLVSPQGFAAGAKVAIGPHQSLLNKPLLGIVGTQKSSANQVYSSTDLKAIQEARGDVVAYPCPGGEYFGMRFGRNSSSDRSRWQDTYTGMTNYLARSFDEAAGIGRFIGELITPDQMREAQNTIGGFLQNEWDEGRIGNAQGTLPYRVTVDASNNPQEQVELGVEKATVMVQYLSVIETFYVDFTGGQTVRIESASSLSEGVA